MENILTMKELEQALNKLDNKEQIQQDIIDPEEPVVHKAKHAVDIINPETGVIVGSYKSLEEAGKFIGVTGTAIGIALRNKKKCKGYLFRYAGISREDQYKDQPVIKICCLTGEKTYFSNIADAAIDAKISSPGLRSRILTCVHTGNYNWIFNKTSTHYVQNVEIVNEI
jgi:hypothetical protein